MKAINVGLIGFGTVGKSVVKTLLSKKKMLRERTGVLVNLVKIADKDLKPRKGLKVPKRLLTKNINSLIKNPDIDIIVELIGGIHPAKEIIMKAIANGKHVVTANKALLAEEGEAIFKAALKRNVSVGFEASVGGGIPIVNILKKSLISNEIKVIYGILNGTSNFILTKMTDEDYSFKEALKEAQLRGIAEKNPKIDLNGRDSSHKLCILSLLGFGLIVKPRDIFVEGIERIDVQDIGYAKAWGYAVKLLAIAKKLGKELDLRVHPTLIPMRRLLANVKDENNAVYVEGDMVGETIFYGKGAGSFPTASSVVSDIIDIAKDLYEYADLRDIVGGAKINAGLGFTGGVQGVKKIDELNTRYYLRFSAIDKPGVLAGISDILAKNKISIATVSQKERKKGQAVPIVMLTHDANEGKMRKALKMIKRLSYVKGKTVKLRIER